MSLQNLVIGVIAVLALALGGLGYVSKAPAPAEKPLGGTSPIVVDGCTEINGVTKCYRKVPFNTSSTTLASVVPPQMGTSTLTSLVAYVTTGTTTATLYEFGKSALYDATTTSMGRFTIPASGRVTMIASTTAAQFGTGGQSGVADPLYVVNTIDRFNLKAGNFVCGSASCSAIRGYVIAEFTL